MIDDTDLDAAIYGAGEAATAVGVPIDTLENMLRPRLGYIPDGTGDVPPNGSGSRRRLTLRTIYHLALMSELITAGIRPQRAAEMAAQFSDAGRGDLRDDPDYQRNPGELFNGPDETLLVVRDGMARVMRSSALKGRATLVVSINEICGRVSRALRDTANRPRRARRATVAA